MDCKKTVYMAVIGKLPADSENVLKLINTVDSCIENAFGCPVNVEWILSPGFSDTEWLRLAKGLGVDCHIIRRESDTSWADHVKTQTVISTRLRSCEKQWISANADVVFAVWNEQVGEMDGAVFEMLEMARGEHLPCAWISSDTGKSYLQTDNYYEKFHPGFLADAIRHMYVIEPPAGTPDENRYKLLFKLGASLQARFFRKHMPKPQNAESSQEASDKDVHYDAETASLCELFQKYDRDAIRCGDKYNAIMYYRAILPAISTVCLAIGFYAADLVGIIRTVAGWLPESLIPAAGRLAAWIPSTGLETVLHWLSGIGFLMNATMLYYTYKMSEDSVLKYWHSRYVNSRMLAESYRVLMHFQPYGVSVDIKKICGKNTYVLAILRDELRQIGMYDHVIDPKCTNDMFESVDAMLKEQSLYHEKCILRYEKVSGFVLHRASVLKKVSLFTLVIRGLMQFMIGIGIFGQNDKTGTIANIFAMLIPNYAAYHVSKNEQCRYSFHFENHKRIKNTIDVFRQRLNDFCQSVGTPSVEMLYSVAENLSGQMIVEDTSSWYDTVSKTSFSRL